jgi:hypothetical protein
MGGGIYEAFNITSAHDLEVDISICPSQPASPWKKRKHHHIIYINSVSLCVCDGGFGGCDGGFGGWGKGEAGEATGDLSATGNRFHFLINCCISLWTQFVCVSKERECEFGCHDLETQFTFNKIVPPNSRAQKLFKTSSFYFLLLFLHPFSRNNCRR